MIQEFIRAFVMIFVAEMGDKSQILAMAFATKFPLRKVITGLFLGILLNHGLAVLLGRALTKIIPISTLQLVAGIAFILFSFWSLKGEEEEDEEETSSKHGALLTVALAFFLGELGDKTQLAAITLSADTDYPVLILSATVSAMMLTGLFGIFVGKKLGDKVPHFLMNIIAGGIFYIFGVLKLYDVVPKEYLTITNQMLFFIVTGGILLFLLARGYQKRKELTLFQKTAQHLKEHYEELQKDFESICLKEGICKECLGSHCPIGYTKIILSGEKAEDFIIDEKARDKHYDKDKLEAEYLSLQETLKDHPDDEILLKVKKQLELLLEMES